MSKRTNLNDWKKQLVEAKQDIIKNMSSEEIEKMKREQKREEEYKRARKNEYLKNKELLYQFLAGYKQNSGIFINNFFRNRDYETYCQDKFHDFDFLIGNIMPHIFNDPTFSWSMVGYLRELEEHKIAYFPIKSSFIDRLIAVSEVFDFLEPISDNTIVYRGCTTIERNGVDGLVSTTPNYKIAEQFSRGTILKIHLPKGTKCIDMTSIRPKEQRKKATEEEILIPPCTYEIIKEEERKKEHEPNNHKSRTKHIEISVKPLDLLEEFLKRMKNPPQEYLKFITIQQEVEYMEALNKLEFFIKNRDENKALKRIRNK